MSVLYTIKHLQAGYQPAKPVLEIEQALNFQKEQITFILGKSGIGKSTLLELLGLMNNTILPNANTLLLFENGAGSYAYNELWNYKDKDLAAFRNANFSFIFQNENLMHNFSAGENICVAQMIQGRSFNEAKTIALQFMHQLEIDQNKFDAPVSAFSGGQRQRLSFIRAVSANYKVLFGDEPTGNLDFHNASKLMQLLKKDAADKKASAIIVSHHIELALAFADQIMIITQKTNEEKMNENSPHNKPVVGEIINHNIFNRSTWIDDKNEFKNYLENSIK